MHWHAGRRMGELCSSLKVDPKTVRKYVAPAIAAGLTPGGPALAVGQWTALAESWFPDLTDTAARQSTWPEFEVHHQRIKDWLRVVTVTTMHQRLRDDHGVTASESSLRRYIKATFSEEIVRRQVVVLRDTPPPGDEAQVDYGLLGRWFDPVTERTRRVWGFLMVLCFSRMLFLRPVLALDERSWVECHVLAFEFFGGAVRRVVPDNLKTGVVKPDLYDPLVNRSFGEFAAHYGTLIDPARVAKPRDKAQIERPVPYARDSFFAGRADEFSDLPHMQREAWRWSAEVANRRPCRPLGRLAPQAVFDAEEKGALQALPLAPFEIASWSTATVHPDIHVKAGKALYSVPWRLIGKQLDIREGTRTVEVFSEGRLVKTHVRIERGKSTDHGDYPPEKIAFFMRTPAWCRRRAGELGVHVAGVVEALLEVNALYRLRQAQGVLRLAEKHEPERLDAACRRALEVGDPTLRTVRGILASGTEHDMVVVIGRVPDAPAHLHGPQGLFETEMQ
ncbi:MAG TPA: IS21 family transposase [Acidimicrobiales bacterium]|nr:IS21 family transposase [Acidimicrobiales bacterium]